MAYPGLSHLQEQQRGRPQLHRGASRNDRDQQHPGPSPARAAMDGRKLVRHVACLRPWRARHPLQLAWHHYVHAQGRPGRGSHQQVSSPPDPSPSTFCKIVGLTNSYVMPSHASRHAASGLTLVQKCNRAVSQSCSQLKLLGTWRVQKQCRSGYSNVHSAVH